MCDAKYWIWLQEILGCGAVVESIIYYYKNAKRIYDTNILELKLSGLFTQGKIDAICSLSIEKAEEYVRECEENGWRIICCDDPAYPRKLREIPDFPLVLFCDGEMPDFNDKLSIGIVGSREATAYAMKAADYLAFTIARCGGIIVSGGARGVDGASHKAALRSGQKTVAVLGNGFGDDYLKQNAQLRQAISNQGCLLTEFPPKTSAKPSNFPIRNRIVAALSDGVIVIEAARKSGSLITARQALQYGRDVFAVPGSIVSESYEGTNALIVDGAQIAVSPISVLDNYSCKYDSIDFSKLIDLKDWLKSNQGMKLQANLPAESINTGKNEKFYLNDVDSEKNSIKEKENIEISLSPELCTVYNSLTQGFEHIDNIIAKCKMSGHEVASALIQLEIMGMVSPAPGKRYRKD